MKKSILITGGCGFIGANLVEFLLQNTDWNINILDNLSTGKWKDIENIESFNPDRIKFTNGDIQNKKDVHKAIKMCDYLVNLAAQTGVIPSIKDPLFDAEINILGIINLLTLSGKYNIKKFVHASSSAPLGEQEMPLNEQKVPAPIAPYGASKLAGEGYCSAFAGSFNLNCVVLRFSNVYGPKSYHKGSVIAKFLKQILAGKSIAVYGDGNQTRDFIYVEDLCKSIYLSLTEKLNNSFEIFQIATGKETSIIQLVEYIKEIIYKNNISRKIKIEYQAARAGEIFRNYSDISKAGKILGFSPAIKLKDGLAKTLDWFNAKK